MGGIEDRTYVLWKERRGGPWPSPKSDIVFTVRHLLDQSNSLCLLRRWIYGRISHRSDILQCPTMRCRDRGAKGTWTVNKLILRLVGRKRANPVSYLHLSAPESPWCYPILSAGTSHPDLTRDTYIFGVLPYIRCEPRAGKHHPTVRYCVCYICTCTCM
jgi:hypothetical protein